MLPEHMILVSVDDHLVEPPNLFEGRVANEYADVSPGVILLPMGATLGSVSAKLDV
ncbi:MULTISPECIES: hypothetical protein [Mycobacterium]|uniref:hypothetical protein n=1 Tax=Mycobacterium TaxID=1763 RepID=UPI001CD967B3|nr:MULTISPECIES: hypothetical protein [Mycobacterium]MCA2242233.1 hypothetical protein [Mycobacterium sp. WUMAC-067]MCA2313732.1 hypothetical protein [Mycobacterium sp. WUMAC-025]MEE3754814.1 hypothetical protein [Mycobacterium intracellulare]